LLFVSNRFALGQTGNAQIKKCKENFFAGWRGFRAMAGVPARQSFSVGGASLLGVLLKKSSNINQKTPHLPNPASFLVLKTIESFKN